MVHQEVLVNLVYLLRDNFQGGLTEVPLETSVISNYHVVFLCSKTSGILSQVLPHLPAEQRTGKHLWDHSP